MKNTNFLKTLEKSLFIIKKILFVIFFILGFVTIMGLWILWQFSSIHRLDSKIMDKDEEIKTLIFCKEKAEEKPNKNDHYNYKFQVKNGSCPVNKNEAINIEEKRLEMCKELKNDIYQINIYSSRIGFLLHQSTKSAKEKVEEEYEKYISKRLCPPSQ